VYSYLCNKTLGGGNKGTDTIFGTFEFVIRRSNWGQTRRLQPQRFYNRHG